MSPGSTEKSVNLCGSMKADKQRGYGRTRVYFGVVLTRGARGVMVFTDLEQCPGETPEGARLLVELLPGVLDRMPGRAAKKPHTLFTDRGPGFYHRRWGTIAGDYESACREHGCKPWAGSNSKSCELEERLQQAVCLVNQKYDVRDLCRGLPDWLRTLVNESCGDRWSKRAWQRCSPDRRKHVWLMYRHDCKTSLFPIPA